MDIFVIKTAEADNIQEDTLKTFAKKQISNPKKLKEHCFSYYLVDKILKDSYKIENRQITFKNGKPILETGEKNFSISHSGDFIAIAFSDFDCGIDIEGIKSRDFKSISLRMGFICKTLDEFYDCWTMYEAEYKLGKRVLSSKNYRTDDYSLSAVSENKDEDYNIFFSVN